MSGTLDLVRTLVASGDARVSAHGYDELAADDIQAGDVVAGLPNAELVEDYPDFPKGPCVLVLEHDSDGRPIHVVWGIPRGESSPAVLITAYRPDPERWSADFKDRRP